MLFTKPQNEITFADVKGFCREFGEGVRVEYKREIKHIPKIVSSFANTHGGVFVIGAETNEYGVVYQRTELHQETASNSEQRLDFSDFLSKISNQVSLARCFYEKCGYIGNIEFVVQLRQVFGKKLWYSTDELGWQTGPLECADSEVSTSEQFPVQDFANSERLINIIEKLASEILWAFNTAKPKKITDLIEKTLRYNNLL